MKIMIHSNGPMMPSGYGQQVRLLLPRLKAMGHDPFVSSIVGVSGSPMNWGEYLILPTGQIAFSPDTIVPNAIAHGADLTITLMDFWKLKSAAQGLAQQNVAAWLPNDCTPLGKKDHETLLASKARPIAMSKFGLKQITEAGFEDVLYVPHVVDTKEFTPLASQSDLREELGLADRFIVGICSANKDTLRKAWPEQFQAFARLHKKHPDTLLMVHAIANSSAGLDLVELAEDMGIADAVIFSDPYAQISGLMNSSIMSDWFGALDVLSCCSYGEGFGVPIIEAQACGTPVVVTDGSAMTELCGSGWLVKGEPFWNPVHRAWWTRPDVDGIVRAYEKAYQLKGTTKMNTMRNNARTFSLEYDADYVASEYWKPALDALEAHE